MTPACGVSWLAEPHHVITLSTVIMMSIITSLQLLQRRLTCWL
jgi:hypothetical protein